MKRNLLPLLLGLGLLFYSPGTLQAQKKKPLKVLYVGGMTDQYNTSTEEHEAEVQKRANAFKELLEKYFTSVTVLIDEQYEAGMSKAYDVTILDGCPKAIRPRIIEKDAAGNITRYEPAAYLPEDFDCAILTIGQTGETVGRSIGSKNDWYCLCLDAHAHHWVKDHPIFKGPFPVKMTVEERPTPEDAYHYAYYYDDPIPATLPMWRVQTKGYITDPGFTIGMVSRPWGYTDSPDAEYISSGVCAKTLDAVAIGRHANFLHWGFAASPAYMTEEAKAVFANAVVYISKFRGKKMLARKFNDRIATREYLKELTFLSTRASYEERMESDRKWTEEMKERYRAAKKKQDAGEQLTQTEQNTLKYGEPEDFKPMSREAYVKRYLKEFYDMFGTDEEAYARFFKENYDYFYSEGFYHIFVDEDVKAWGIPNHDKRLLDKAITCLEQGIETERANRVLARYTMADFKTPAEWRQWYNTYNGKFFFTEAGGWKFMINGESSLPGNDYFSYRKRMEEEQTETAEEQTSDANPVAVTASVRVADGKRELVVRFKIHPGYHIYADVAPSDPYIPTEIKLELPEGVSAGSWKASQPGKFGETGTTIYESSSEYTCPLEGNGRGKLKCTVSYQCCDTHVCMPPVNKELEENL